MIRFLILLVLLFVCRISYSQQTIKVRKSKTIDGFYQLETEHKTKEIIYFDKKGNVALIISSKRKKAKGNLLSCIENNNCQMVSKSTYQLNDLEITFSFNRKKNNAIYFVEYDGKFSADGLFLTLKKGETGKMVDVKEFRRLK